MREILKKRYKETFAEEPNAIYFSPGRVNLIGEHIDYNGGHVFPCAISLGIYGCIHPRTDRKIGLYSLNMTANNGFTEEDLDNFAKNNQWTRWVDYPLGVIAILKQQGYTFTHGFDIMVSGDLPNASGLSSSAALEMITIYMLNEMFDFQISPLQQAIICQKAENDYVGVACGIMDQFAVAMGKKDAAIYLDTNKMIYKYAPLKLANNKLVIINSGKKRGLANSNYNLRRQECEQALKQLQSVCDITNLCDLTPAQFITHAPVITSSTLYKRAKHAVYENERTIKSFYALTHNDLVGFGRLMFKSHDSLRKDYQVSCFELNTIVNIARNHHAKGARMTGAGFGGCVVVIIKDTRLPDFLADIKENYPLITGYSPSIYLVETSDGTHRLEE